MVGGTRGQMYFHGGSGPNFLKDDARYWYEKQALFKYYNIQNYNVTQYYEVKDAIIGKIVPHRTDLQSAKDYAQ